MFLEKFKLETPRLNNQNAQIEITKQKRTVETAAASGNNNKTGTSKVGAISKAQKAQKFFLEKNEIFFSKKVA